MNSIARSSFNGSLSWSVLFLWLLVGGVAAAAPPRLLVPGQGRFVPSKVRPTSSLSQAVPIPMTCRTVVPKENKNQPPAATPPSERLVVLACPMNEQGSLLYETALFERGGPRVSNVV
eukprot:CAMPEP_0172440150 /NCGR_PEP_ID=MMETSP1065-20121228/889_1 /TAXON_ID=265537 /ORGANISM="Amphiprora paludosa, Strain CCMP125" /LENGTH=117 /DNA_ID=CAMNT_0013188933 /DNA_START=55 /DNA_END=408 /DNA_ORIENTATION=-